MHRRLEVAIFCALAAAWIPIYALIAPPFGGTDVFIFKDAGANLALGHGFRSIPAPFFEGDPTPRVFASYTPLYPLLYGAWGKVFGIGAYSSGYFDLVLGVVASGLTLCLLLPSLGQNSGYVPWPDGPDKPAMGANLQRLIDRTLAQVPNIPLKRGRLKRVQGGSGGDIGFESSGATLYKLKRRRAVQRPHPMKNFGQFRGVCGTAAPSSAFGPWARRSLL